MHYIVHYCCYYYLAGQSYEYYCGWGCSGLYSKSISSTIPLIIDIPISCQCIIHFCLSKQTSYFRCMYTRARPLWPISSFRPSNIVIPKCSCCGGPQCFEFQVWSVILILRKTRIRGPSLTELWNYCYYVK